MTMSDQISNPFNRLPIKIGTRNSPLALVQTQIVCDQLKKYHKLSSDDIKIISMTTSGDQILDKSLSEIGGKGLFIKELEKALLDGSIDIAVHSLKDMETHLLDEFEIICVLEREDPRDAFVSVKYKSFDELPHGAVLGTSSVRRSAFALSLRPDLQIKVLRGNMGTRYQKILDGQYDAAFFAYAGLKRLRKEDWIKEIFEIDRILPAASQGAIAIEALKGRQDLKGFLKPLHCPITYKSILLERAFLAQLDGTCKTPIAAYAWQKKADSQSLFFHGILLKEDGTKRYETKTSIEQIHAKTDQDFINIGYEMGKEVQKKQEQ